MRGDRIIRDLLRFRFVITMETGETFAGLLVDADKRTLIFTDAQQIAANGDRLNVDGWLYLDRSRVAYMQRPGGGA